MQNALFNETLTPVEFAGEPPVKPLAVKRRRESVFKNLSGDLRTGLPKINTHAAREKVFENLRDFGPATSKELAARLSDVPLLTIRPRLSELKSKGRIRAAGERRGGENVFQVA